MQRRTDALFKDKKDLKVLLINPFGIGDLLFSTPLIGILKRELPNTAISYICNKRSMEVIEKDKRIHKIFVFEKGDYKKLWNESPLSCLKKLGSFLKTIRNERFDIAIDMSMGHQYGLFLSLVRVPLRVGFDYKGRARFHNARLRFDGFDDKPIAEYYKDLLRLIGIDVSNEPIKIYLDKEDEQYIENFFKNNAFTDSDKIIGIAPGGGVSFGEKNIAFKRWPAEKFACLADAFQKRLRAKVILIWAPGEEDLLKSITSLMETRPIIAPKTTIRQSAALFSRCHCVVCNDGGPLHIAAASGARTVSIFGPSDEDIYGPYPKGVDHAIVSKEIQCRPCYKKFKIPECSRLSCLKDLNVQDLFDAVNRHITEEKREFKGAVI